MIKMRALIGCLAALSLLALPTPAYAKQPRVAQSAVDKPIGACFLTVGLGALAGALLSKKKGNGALVGAGVGGAICAILIASAKHKDKLIAAQRAAAASASQKPYFANYRDEDGQAHIIKAVATDVTPLGPLQQVKYTDESGAKAISPPLAEPQKCRMVDVTDNVNGSGATISGQLMCYNALTSKMEPYAAKSYA